MEQAEKVGAKSSYALLVFTWFFPEMPGYLLYNYRLRTLLQHSQLLVISNLKKARHELNVPEERFHYLPGNAGSIFHIFRYFISVISTIRLFRPKKVVLLHTFFAPLIPLVYGRKVVLLWNEHPLHLFPYEVPGKLGRMKALKNSVMRWLAFTGARMSSCVMASGKYLQEDLLEHGCKRESVRLIYQGVDRAFISSPEKATKQNTYTDRRPLNVIYSGTVQKERGRDIMLQALAMVNQRKLKIRLTFVGASTEEYAYCRRRADKLNVSEYFTVLKRVSGSEIPHLLHKADAGICIWAEKPHWRFNPPTKLFEYLVAGLPVMASNIRTHTLYIKNWENGLIFDYDAGSLSAALNLLWERQAKLPAMRAKALESGQKYLWERIEPKFIEAIDTLA